MNGASQRREGVDADEAQRASVRFDVLALGEAMVEFNATRSEDARTWLQGFGGDTSNAAIAAARLGARAGYVSRFDSSSGP
jgi:2-dehydro-3-deoxygluconokinase